MRAAWILALTLGLPAMALAEEALVTPKEKTQLHEFLSSIWNFAPIEAGSNIRISVGQIVIGVVGLVIAWIAARALAGIIARAIRRRVNLAVEHGEVLEKGLFYLFATMLVLTILQWLSIPLTVFAFLGGAVAIGIGFGTQALMNNFISGLILLFERGIRVGDLINVDGNLGRVTKLGSRCSQIRQPDGVEVLVPNSMFLEKNVVNWTLTDSNHRYDFTIGFAYGADTAAIIEVLNRAMTEHAEVLKDPAPAVYFDAFGGSALVFHLYYWISLDRSNSLQVGSDIRLRIDALCREAGIDIPFPQRDFRLHSTEPLIVQLQDLGAKVAERAS
jgi:small-conductance mechanosensitive channel